jgi:hypothetical protein
MTASRATKVFALAAISLVTAAALCLTFAAYFRTETLVDLANRLFLC